MIPARQPLPLPLPLPLRPLPNHDQGIKPAKNKSTKKAARLFKRAMLLFLIMGVLAATVVYRHAQIAVKERSIARLSAEISAMRDANAKLEVVALELSALPRIEKVARVELGMQHPAVAQILRIGVQGGH